MSNAEIKLNLFRLIDQIEDDAVLANAYRRLLAILRTDEDVARSPLFKSLEESLRISSEQIAEGKVISHEEVMEKHTKRFRKEA